MRLLKTFAFLAILIAPAGYADDYYLELQGIPGDSTGAGHRNWIDILTFEQGVDVPGDNDGDDREGQPAFRELRFCKYLDRSSVPIQRAAIAGNVIPAAKFDVVSQGKVILRYEFTNVRIRRYHIKGEKPNRPKDCFSLTFGTIKMTFISYDENDKPTETSFEWDVESNSEN